MKKKTNPMQWGLEECIAHLLRHMCDEDLEWIRNLDESELGFRLHHNLGRWIRNECGLWEFGTDKLVDDIVREYNDGNLKSELLDNNRFTHPKLPFDLMNTTERGVTAVLIPCENDKKKRPKKKVEVEFDCTLAHPDNCSAVVVEVICQRVRSGH